MTPFVPSKTYEGLLKQANSLHTLASSQERRISMLNASIEKLTRDYAAIGQDAMNAEREINQQLTNYVEELEEKLEKVVVWRATNGSQSCYFGSEGQAAVFARKSGRVERIELNPLPQLSTVNVTP